MEKKVKTIQMPKEIVTYVANDGTEFSFEEECKTYEDTARCAINTAIKKIQMRETNSENILSNAAPWNWESVMRAIPIRNVNDVEIVNKWIISINGSDKTNCISTDDIGKTLIFEDGSRVFDAIYLFGTIEDMIEQFRKTVEKYLGEETQEENA